MLTAPYIEDTGGDIVALDPHALKKLFTTTIGLLQVGGSLCLLLAFFGGSGAGGGKISGMDKCRKIMR